MPRIAAGEAVDIIAALFDADGEGTVNYRGDYFDTESARLWDLPDERVPIGVAVSGPDSCQLAGEKADMMIAVEPEAELGERFDRAGGARKSRIGQVAIAYGADKEAAVKRAHDQFRWFGLGWKVNADLPNPDSFESATQLVAPDQVADALSCGPDVDEHVEAIKAFVEAGSTRWRSCRSAPRSRTRSPHGPGRSCCRRSARFDRPFRAFALPAQRGLVLAGLAQDLERTPPSAHHRLPREPQRRISGGVELSGQQHRTAARIAFVADRPARSEVDALLHGCEGYAVIARGFLATRRLATAQWSDTRAMAD